MKTLWSLIQLTFRRLYSRPGLTVLALFGVVLAVGLLSSTAFFTQAVDRVILNQELAELSRVTGRIPFSTRVYFLPSSRVPVGMTEAENVGQSVSGSLSQEIGLPVSHFGLHIESKGMMLLPKEGDTRYEKSFLGTVSIGYVTAIEEHITAIAGQPFSAETVSSSDELTVWMHTDMAADMGVNVGETFDVALNISQPRQQVRIAGLWHSTDATERFWFNNPDSNFKDVLLVSRADYVAHVQPILASKSGLVAWHIILDERRMNPANARQYAEGFELGMQVVEQYLPGARLDVSALDPLKDFVQRQTTLTTILLGFNVPALGFLVAFLILISVIIAEWQRRETAIMVSRGMALEMVLGLVLLEELLLFMIGLPVGVALGMGLARFMGNTVSFLAFDSRPDFPVSLQGANLGLIAMALGFSLLARLVPVILASRQSVVAQAQERARPIRSPIWQRTYLDLLMILPTYYIYDQLSKRGSLAQLVDENPDEIFRDPLLILLPALFVLTAALLSMRVFPLVMRLFDRAASRMPFLTVHLALRQLGRYTQGYMNPLLLVIISLALGIYTYSLAASLDQWLVDRVYFQVGADVSFMPSTIDGSAGSSVGGGANNSAPAGSAGWIPPKDEYSKVDGVIQAGRMGRYPASIPGTADGEIRGHFLGIDRVDFPNVGWYRNDFAPESLGALMNRLAIAPENVLVSEEYLKLTGRRIGDKIRIEIRMEEGIRVLSEFTIAGLYTYFPTVNQALTEGEGRRGRYETTVIGNLDHLFFLGGAQYPHRILLRTLPDEVRSPEVLASPGIATSAVSGLERGTSSANIPGETPPGQAPPDQTPTLFDLVEKLGFPAIHRQDAAHLIAEEQAKFERVGIFGTLSVGFLAATLMAVLALLVYSNASLQERLYQFGIMRAVGLMRGQLLGQVILEYSILITYGALIGLWIGAATSTLFVPFFRITAGQNAPLPPLIPVIAQEQVIPLTLSFALAMVIVETLLIVRAMRGRLFDALRIGHQG